MEFLIFVLSDVKSEHLEIIVDEESHSMMVRSYYGRSTLIAKESEWFDCTPEAMKFIAEKARNTYWNIENPMKVETKLYFNIADVFRSVVERGASYFFEVAKKGGIQSA